MIKPLFLFLALFNFNFTVAQTQFVDKIKEIDKTIPNHTGWKNESFNQFLIEKKLIDQEVFDLFSDKLIHSKNLVYYIYFGSIPSHGKTHVGIIISIKDLNTNETLNHFISKIDNKRDLSNKHDNEFDEEYFNFVSNDYTKTKGLNILKYTDGSETFHSLNYHMIEFIYEINLDAVSNGMIFSSFNYYASEKMMGDFFEE